MADVHSYATLQEECIVKYQFGWDKKKCSKRMIKVKSNLSFWPVIDAEKEDSEGRPHERQSRANGAIRSPADEWRNTEEYISSVGRSRSRLVKGRFGPALSSCPPLVVSPALRRTNVSAIVALLRLWRALCSLRRSLILLWGAADC